MRFYVFLLSFLFSAAQLSFAQGVSFEHGSWAEVLEKAKTENKLIFMDAFTTWCGPCKMMSRNVFPDEKVGSFYNENFVNVKMDMEKGEGPGLASKYFVQAYPTLLYIDGDGEVVHRTAGYFGIDEFIGLGSAALKPELRLSGLNAKYAADNREPEFLMSYTSVLANAMDNRYLEVADAYIETQGDLGTDVNMGFIMDYVADPESKGFKYFIQNRAQFEEKFGKPAAENKVVSALNAFIDKNPDQPFAEVDKVIRKLYGKDGDRFSTLFKMSWSRERGDRDGYSDAAISYFDKYKSKDPDELNEAAWVFYKVVEDKKKLKKALSWSKKSVKLDKSYYNMDTMAALYFKLKKKKKAIKTARAAIELARASGEDFSETQAVLDAAYKL